jgi:hypothetical protein
VNIKNMFKNLVARVKAYFAKKSVPAAPVVNPDTTPIVPPAPAVVLPAGCTLASISNAPGLVFLTGSFVSPYYKSLAYAIDEVAKCFPEGSAERTFIEGNVQVAQEEDKMDMIYGPCRFLDKSGRGVGDNIQGTFVCVAKQPRDAGDKYRTVAQAQAYFGSLADPTTNGSFVHPR